MPVPVKHKKFKKALIITRNRDISSLSRLVLKDKIFCLVMNSAPDAKVIFKSSEATQILILDWSLQDKYNSLYKCLVEAKARKKVLIVNIFSSKSEKSFLLKKIPNLKSNNKVYFVSSELLSISLLIVLLKIRKRLASLEG
ncbi:MAG: hypothetical protein A2622_09415 [Bdellovibrionales bacterium RIFCSPHIGHO2_01_FULL_40_29]|nr:MAG: hypothetical protein A2622_09415 [Bdellovibrionales bacterium RIFCSPHIGHO2_01_FULL_40_29]OFZ33557.1 MAG: hypothetical protein A3D17_00205 [Bdellovibrionales bacterium RIFCSPHIGHO2_02_FULL_40_15]